MQLETYGLEFYMSLCNKEELKRIKSPENEKDYLLKLRANVTVEQIRIYRVFLSRMRSAGKNWNFNDSFEHHVFDDYLSNLSSDDLNIAQDITAGMVFCNDPNGRIINTEFGKVITISESLKYFLYYMNLAFLEYDDSKIPSDVRWAALKIGLRIMLKSEALDFDLDPRGVIPNDIHLSTMHSVDQQLLFILSHEYSHYFLGHMDSASLIPDLEHNAIEGPENKMPKYFTHDQKQELDADIDAIERLNLEPKSTHIILTSAIFFFAYIELLSNVKNQISPSINLRKTHPAPLDRLHNIVDHFMEKCEIDMTNVSNVLKNIEILKPLIQEDISTNFDSWEQYGSVYLGCWRGKPLVDRVDY